jgi:hypothetical protein
MKNIAGRAGSVNFYMLLTAGTMIFTTINLAPAVLRQFIMKAGSTVNSTGSVYEIKLKGILPDQWSDWFDGMEIRCDADGNTQLRGVIIDQSELHGILDKVCDLGLPLLSVKLLSDQN